VPAWGHDAVRDELGTLPPPPSCPELVLPKISSPPPTRPAPADAATLSIMDPQVSPVTDAPTAVMRPADGSAPRGTILWWSMPPGLARRGTVSNDPCSAPSRAPSDDKLAQMPTNLLVARLVLTTTDGGTDKDSVTWRRAWFLLISRPDYADRIAVGTALKCFRELMAS